MTRRLRIRHGLSLFVSALMLVGCASTPPPTGELVATDAAIAAAREAGAAEFAPVEFGFAQDKRRAAASALDEREYDTARLLALQAEADARLAEAKARAAIGRNAVQQRTRENAELRRDLLGGQP